MQTNKLGLEVSSDPLQPRPPEPAPIEGPRAAPNPLYGRSQIDKWKSRIVRFGFGFQNISPEKPKPTELFIIKKKKKRRGFDMYITCQEQPMPSNANPRLKASFSHTPSQHKYQPFILN